MSDSFPHLQVAAVPSLQGFLLSSTQQQVDRLVLQTGEVVRTLRRSGSDIGGSNSLQWVEGLITDADSSKQVSLATRPCVKFLRVMEFQSVLM